MSGRRTRVPDDDDFDDGGIQIDCGRMPDGTCQMAGSEWCEFECPYREEDQ